MLKGSGLLGKVKYYAIRVEFQFSGSPHIHSFLWILNAPSLSEKPFDDYVDFLDSVLYVHLPSEEEDSHLYHLVKTVQMHCDSKTCRKYKNIACHFKFGSFFREEAIAAKPVQSTSSQVEKFEILNKRSKILFKVKNTLIRILIQAVNIFLVKKLYERFFLTLN